MYESVNGSNTTKKRKRMTPGQKILKKLSEPTQAFVAHKQLKASWETPAQAEEPAGLFVEDDSRSSTSTALSELIVKADRLSSGGEAVVVERIASAPNSPEVDDMPDIRITDVNSTVNGTTTESGLQDLGGNAGCHVPERSGRFEQGNDHCHPYLTGLFHLAAKCGEDLKSTANLIAAAARLSYDTVILSLRKESTRIQKRADDLEMVYADIVAQMEVLENKLAEVSREMDELHQQGEQCDQLVAQYESEGVRAAEEARNLFMVSQDARPLEILIRSEMKPEENEHNVD